MYILYVLPENQIVFNGDNKWGELENYREICNMISLFQSNMTTKGDKLNILGKLQKEGYLPYGFLLLTDDDSYSELEKIIRENANTNRALAFGINIADNFYKVCAKIGATTLDLIYFEGNDTEKSNTYLRINLYADEVMSFLEICDDIYRNNLNLN